MANIKLWQPDSESFRSSEMGRYLQHVQAAYPEAGISDYESLYRWSIEQLETFWQDWLDYSGILFSGSTDTVLQRKQMPNAGFFPDVHLNFAENLLRHSGNAVAITGVSESRDDVRLTHDQLYAAVSQVEQSLRRMGVVAGDRVAAYMPNIPETMIAALAVAAIGAVWSSCSPDFGTESVVDRFGQIQPRLLFCVDAYVHKGQTIDCIERVQGITRQLPSVEQVVVLCLMPNHPKDWHDKSGQMISWKDWITETASVIQYERLPFDHPLCILYSSGTTGIPKCIVHGAGGTLLQQVKELSLHCDLRVEDNITYVTTCGWMMWNWLMSGLFTGATVTLFDGFPGTPSISRLWDLIDTQGITHFGSSPRFLAASRRRLKPSESHRLSTLRVILSTGAPLLPEEFDWVYQDVKRDVQLSSISGGTDIISCFMLGNPLLGVYRGEIQCLGLGMDVIAASAEGEPLLGEKGELVCKSPFVSMPVEFWNDPDGQKYHDAYFTGSGDCWSHGDLIENTGSQGSSGGIIVHGRSDATLKPGGVRIGTAEIYRVVESLDEISDSIVIGQPWRGDIRIVLYVQLEQNAVLDDELMMVIRASLRTQASPRHVPAVILEVASIPYTRSGKKVELAVRDIAMGLEPTNREALQNPEALACFQELS
ncbi:MAG: acetoacetate--CoA ligase [Planctomycetota bacterium]|nr:acetoacetate--CoA ligase [Planctomycetota bacterium]